MTIKGERSRDKLKELAGDLARAVLDTPDMSAELRRKAAAVLSLVIAKQGQRDTLTIEQQHELVDIMDGALNRGATQEVAAELARSTREYFVRLEPRQLINIYKKVPIAYEVHGKRKPTIVT